jgi:hypothetical protein
MPDYDHTLLVHHDWLAKSEFPDGCRHAIDSMLVDTRVVRVGLDAFDVP